MFKRPSATRALIVALIVTMVGCQSAPAPRDDASAAVPADAADTPRNLLDEAARAPEGRQARLYLLAAETFLADGNIPEAADALGLVDVDRLRDAEAARYLLAGARVALARDELEEARAALLSLDEAQLPNPLGGALAWADLLVAEGHPQAAATHVIGFAGDGAEQRVNDAVWHFLGMVAPFEVMEMESRTRGRERAWWLLKSQMLQAFTLNEQRQRLSAWRQAHPDHPATVIPPTALVPLDEPREPVARVALMLPLTGPLSRAGRSVRDGFIATYLAHRAAVDYEILVYDTAAEPLATLYERALVAGAEVLIGPLAKESVAEMNALNPEIPVLALNYLGDEVPAANLLQLGLAIEDEAHTLERWLADARAERVLAFHNAEEWSQRALRALSEAWDKPLTVQMLENIRTVTESVGAAMHVAASQQRRDDIQNLLGEPLEFLPRARGDVDAIVALVTPLEATALVPALRFHFAQRVPVYATSQTIRGIGPERLRELNGFRITELPWFTQQEESFRTLDAAFELANNPFAALYALGVDAFRLADRTPLIISGHFTQILGSTGELEFSPSGRIERRLARAMILSGRIVPTTGIPGR